MLPRTLEPEVMDDSIEANEYDGMDHTAVNTAFVSDLLETGEIGSDILDLGTGTALIPIELCHRLEHVRVIATDSSTTMLDLAIYHIDVAGLRDRIQLQHSDARGIQFEDHFFDCVISNSLIHHLENPEPVLRQAARVLRPGGTLFVRDLFRPATDESLEQLVSDHSQNESELSQQLLRQSLHAALTIPEIRDIGQKIGIAPQYITQTSDRHWTLAFYKQPLD